MDLKNGLKAALYRMGDESGGGWMQQLPWVLLGKRTAMCQDLGATPAEMVLGVNPAIPGDLITTRRKPSSEDIQKLLDKVGTNAAQPPVPTAHHRIQEEANMPDFDKVTHVYIKRGKTTPLGPRFDGPFQIMERLSNSCLKIKVGMYASGEPKYEMQHLSNCKAVALGSDITPAQRPLVGRKKLNPDATKFVAQSKRDIPSKVQTNKNWSSAKDIRDMKAHNRPQRQRRQPNRYLA